MKKAFRKPKFVITAALTALCITATGCSLGETKKPAAPYDGQNFLQELDLTQAGQDPKEYAASLEVIKNFDTKLSVPTYITKVNDTYFIVDCYHNRIIYSDSLDVPLTEWYIMSGDATQPHTLASDGTVYLVDDTENNRVLVFEKIDSKFVNTQTLNGVGSRPHYSLYDPDTDTFYVWSSKTGELFCLRHTPDSTKMYLTDIRKIPVLDGIYVRSFSIIDGDIYFVSGISDAGDKGKIYCCNLDTLEIKKTIDVPDELAGMVQITKIQDYYYISTSTDLTGSQDHATLIRTKKLENLMASDYEDIYSKYFIGGGTPYYITNADDTYFLTEHRLMDHQIWSFKVTQNEITDVKTVY
ncbi:MAG: hypothetical protein K6F75_09060 [Butyrivibrio sp.]|nr:hypothetical protein [Butyrivibrio sp.]